MNESDTGILDEAYERFHTTGPEFDDGLTNHGPMAVEAMVRHGQDGQVHAWIDWYQDRLDEAPRGGISPVTRENWQEALGEIKRVGDWTSFMLREVELRPWRDLLAEWWPRLLPGITASATHGVIRVGHSVRALLAEEESPTDGPRLAEFAHALAYWAARWSPLNVATPPYGGLLSPSAALAEVPGVPEQTIGVTHRLSQLSETPGWTDALSTLRTPESPRQVPNCSAQSSTPRCSTTWRMGTPTRSCWSTPRPRRPPSYARSPRCPRACGYPPSTPPG
jgi:hypothetical protein